MDRQGDRTKGVRTKAPLPCRNIGLASGLLGTLGNPTRLAIVCLLMDGERSVAQIEDALGIGQPTLSQQLAVLRVAGVIAGTRQARTVVYGLFDDRARRVVGVLRDIFADLLPRSVLLPEAGDHPSTPPRDAVLARLAEREMM